MRLRQRDTATVTMGLESMEQRRLLSAGHGGHGHEADFVTQTNLVSDGSVPAVTTDAHLKNAWGISNAPGSAFWVSSNKQGISVLYDGLGGKKALEVTIPGGGGQQGAPSGQVANTGDGFVVSAKQPDGTTKSGPARFIFVGEDGGISGWNPQVDGTHAVLKIDDSDEGSIYKAATLADRGAQTFLYVTDFHNGSVDVYDGNWVEQTLPAGAFADRRIPRGYAPFDVKNLGGLLYVTFAKQDAAGEDDVAGAGRGFVDVFDTTGHLVRRLEHGGFMNSPWGLARAPADWGQFSGDVLVGMFGSGRIAAFDPASGRFDGLLRNADGSPVRIDGLWSLTFGNGAASADPNTLYFTAGPDHEQGGLFGSLTLHPRTVNDDDHGHRGHDDDGDDAGNGRREDVDPPVWH